MAAFNRFNSWTERMTEDANLASDTFALAFSNTAPSASNTVIADIVEIAYTGVSSRNLVTTSSSQTAGDYSLVFADLTVGSSVATASFRYVIVYDSTVNALVGWYDLGSTTAIAAGQSLLFAGLGVECIPAIPVPDNFGWIPSVNVFKIDGEYVTDYDPTPFLIEGAAGVTTYYVDGQTGNDGNPGTSGSPKKSLTTITGGRVTKLLIKARGTFYRSDGGDIQMAHDNLCVEAWGGADLIITTEASPNFPYVWTDEGGGVWSAPSPYALHNGHRPYLGTDIETLTPYTAAADVAACQATAGSWVRTTGPIKHWIHTSDGTSPASGHTIYGNNGSGSSYNAASQAYVQRIAFHGVSFRGGDAAFSISGNNVTYAKRLDFVGCDFKRGGQLAAFATSGNASIINYECIAGPSSFDGFSYTTATGAAGGGPVPNAIEINCIGRYNGNASTGANQGSTTHFTGKLVRVNCEYYNNADDQIADVGADTRSWNLGCTLGPKGIGSGKSGAQIGNDATDARGWFDGCVFTSLDYGWGTGSGATIYYKNMTAPSTHPSSTGTITTY